MSASNGAIKMPKTAKTMYVDRSNDDQDHLATEIEKHEAAYKHSEAAMAANRAEIERLRKEKDRHDQSRAADQQMMRATLLKDAAALEQKAQAYKTKADIDEALEKAEYYRELAAEIAPLGDEAAPVDYPPAPAPNESMWPVLWVATKVALLIVLCSWAVLSSDDWISQKYQDANVYNEISFQKVLFGFAVYIAAFVASIVAMAVFFPGFARYFNPFNHHNLDFYDDFQQLDAWKRNVIGFGLWAIVFLGFVLIATGKLD